MKNKYHYIDYKKEYKKYKNMIINLQKEKDSYIQKIIRLRNKENFEELSQEEVFPLSPTNQQVQNLSSFPKIYPQKDNPRGMIDILPLTEEEKETRTIEEQIRLLESEPLITFDREYLIDQEIDLFEQENFLYHGLRYGIDVNSSLRKGLEKLEGILKEGKILAGKYLEDYYPYSDNCNEGEYISLISYSDSIEFETFVGQNICLIISPFCQAYKTVYVPFDTWDYIKKNNIPIKNRYSYAHGEYQVKDSIPIEKVRAIGIPYLKIRLQQNLEVANKYKEGIIALLNHYNIDLPIVDINCYNQIIDQPKKRISDQKIYSKH